MASDKEYAIDQTPGRRLAMASDSECYDSYEKDGDDWIPRLAARGGHTHVAAQREPMGERKDVGLEPECGRCWVARGGHAASGSLRPSTVNVRSIKHLADSSPWPTTKMRTMWDWRRRWPALEAMPTQQHGADHWWDNGQSLILPYRKKGGVIQFSPRYICVCGLGDHMTSPRLHEQG
jgi:hypothetical protein